MQPVKQIALLVFWALNATLSIGGFLYVASYLWMQALFLQWGIVEQLLAPSMLIITTISVWFTTRKVADLLYIVANQHIQRYNQPMIKNNENDRSSEPSEGNQLKQIASWTLFFVLGFWGVHQLLISIMDRLP